MMAGRTLGADADGAADVDCYIRRAWDDVAMFLGI